MLERGSVLLHIFCGRGDPRGRIGVHAHASAEKAHAAVNLGTGVDALLAHPDDGSVLVLRVDGSAARVDPDTGSILAQTPPGTLSRRAASSSLRTARCWLPPLPPATCACSTARP